MPEEPKVKKSLAEQEAFEDGKQALINDILEQKGAANKGFDEQLAKLDYQEDGAKPRRAREERNRDEDE